MYYKIKSLCFFILFLSLVDIVNAEVVTIEAKIKSINGDKIVVDRKGKETEFDLSKNIDTTSFKSGQSVSLKVHLDLEIVVKIEPISSPTIDPVLAKMKGTWLCIASEEVGRVKDRETVKRQNRRMKIDGTNFSVERVIGKNIGTYVGTIKINSDKNTFDFKGKGAGGNKDVAWIGIYELKGDMLKLCFRYNQDGKAKRPTKFKTDSLKPNICILHTYKKETEN